MPNELKLMFSPSDVQTLLDEEPDKIVVRLKLEEATLSDSSKAGVLKVYADAHRTNNSTPLATINGCPEPPCSEDD